MICSIHRVLCCPESLWSDTGELRDRYCSSAVSFDVVDNYFVGEERINSRLTTLTLRGPLHFVLLEVREEQEHVPPRAGRS